MVYRNLLPYTSIKYTVCVLQFQQQQQHEFFWNKTEKSWALCVSRVVDMVEKGTNRDRN